MSNYPYEYERCLDMEQEEPSQLECLKGFGPLLGLTEVIGGVVIILMTTWIGYYRGGFSWKSHPELEFNWHPLLMTIGLVFLYGNALLIYRIRRNTRKRQLKLTHAVMMSIIITLTVIALIAVFDSHNLAVDIENNPKPIPNMYSMHSWLGLITVLLFCCQFCAGCVTFLLSVTQITVRIAYMPFHIFFGIVCFVCTIAACLVGLNEKALFALSNTYSAFAPEGILINVIGILLVVFGGLCVYLVTQERYRRRPRPEDDVLLPG